MTPALYKAIFRSKFEEKVVSEILAREPGFDVDAHYEAARIPYMIPARKSFYVPDLYFPDRKLVIEMKGRFRSVDERVKYLHFRESNPDIEVRFVLMRAGVKLYKNSPTSQEQWLAKQGFTYAIGSIPPEWLA
ncbi:hypothetical protein ACFZ8E_07590 [Methylobacterium sp. HMF5984]|uniref:hypothetical protein n=1 Tax=Methylobacterium sp. HMF5984 TaxID=3367370 RepID=UPI003854C5A7